ncbi:MAG: large conductance mechanosensitive channel protein MscL [Oscillospiraceae bacterium]|nr:large conductance mechanosensitive channel protein MscL [Oscillospiraceae bacterium]
MKKFFGEFKTFITKGNVLDMAVGVIIGAAFGAITNALVNNVINPLLAWLFKAPDFTKLNIMLRPAEMNDAGEVTQEALVLGIGVFINAILNFIIVAFVLFCVIKAFNKAKALAETKKKEEEEAKPEEPAGPSTEELLTEILAELKKK